MDIHTDILTDIPEDISILRDAPSDVLHWFASEYLDTKTLYALSQVGQAWHARVKDLLRKRLTHGVTLRIFKDHQSETRTSMVWFGTWSYGHTDYRGSRATPRPVAGKVYIREEEAWDTRPEAETGEDMSNRIAFCESFAMRETYLTDMETEGCARITIADLKETALYEDLTLAHPELTEEKLVQCERDGSVYVNQSYGPDRLYLMTHAEEYFEELARIEFYALSQGVTFFWV